MDIRDQSLPVTRSMLPSCLVLALTLALAGCNSEWVVARQRVIQAHTQPPGNSYKVEIAPFLRTALNDPTGVRRTRHPPTRLPPP